MSTIFVSGISHHHPVLRVHKVYRASGLPLHSLVDDASSHAVNQEDPHKAALLVGVRALSHHSKKVGVQILRG